MSIPVDFHDDIDIVFDRLPTGRCNRPTHALIFIMENNRTLGSIQCALIKAPLPSGASVVYRIDTIDRYGYGVNNRHYMTGHLETRYRYRNAHFRHSPTCAASVTPTTIKPHQPKSANARVLTKKVPTNEWYHQISLFSPDS